MNMKTAESKTVSPIIQRKAAGSFFKKGNESFFGNETMVEQSPFFNRAISNNPSGNGKSIQTKCTSCEQKDNLIQRQEQPDQTITKDVSPDTTESSTPNTGGGSFRAKRCNAHPEFPDFRCFAYELKLDVDENLRNNAYRFYQVASLHPDDNELMWNTFLRYGLGVNLLQTSFGFLGANNTLGTVLSYGTGIGLKSYDFFKNGVLKLDVPIPLGRGVNLDLQLDLNTDPNNLTNVRSVNTSIGITGHFK